MWLDAFYLTTLAFGFLSGRRRVWQAEARLDDRAYEMGATAVTAA